MDGLFHGKPVIKMGWFGGTIIFGNTYMGGVIPVPFKISFYWSAFIAAPLSLLYLSLG